MFERPKSIIGLNPNHIAAGRAGRVQLAALGALFKDIRDTQRGQPGSFSGATISVGLNTWPQIGAALKNAASNTDYLGFSGRATAVGTPITVGAVLIYTTATANAAFFSTSQSTAGGWRVGVDSGGSNLILSATGATTVASTTALPTNVPLFIGVGYDGGSTVQFLVRRLDNAALTTQSVSGTASPSAGDGIFTVGNCPTGGTSRSWPGSIGYVTYLNIGLPLAQLILWSMDPWGFWLQQSNVSRSLATAAGVSSAMSGRASGMGGGRLGYAPALLGRLIGISSARAPVSPAVAGRATGVATSRGQAVEALAGRATGTGTARGGANLGLSGRSTGSGKDRGTPSAALSGRATGQGQAKGSFQSPVAGSLTGRAGGVGTGRGQFVTPLSGRATGQAQAQGPLVSPLGATLSGRAGGGGKGRGTLTVPLTGLAKGSGSARGQIVSQIAGAMSGRAGGAGWAGGILTYHFCGKPILMLTQSQIQTVFRDFLLGILPCNVPVIAGQANRVAEPKSPDYVVFWPVMRGRLAWAIDGDQDALFTGTITGIDLAVTAVDPRFSGQLAVGIKIFGVGIADGTYITALGTGTGGIGTYTISKPANVTGDAIAAGSTSLLQKTELVLQCDAHGPNSSDNAQIISTVMSDPVAERYFKPNETGVAPLYAESPRQIPFINGESQYETRWVVDCHIQANQPVLFPQEFAGVVEVDVISVDAEYPPN